MKKKNIAWAAILILFLACAVFLQRRDQELKTGAAGELEPARVVFVIDGDTLLVETDTGTEAQKLRLIGVDCEESVSREESENTKKGEEAAEYVRGLLPEGSRIWLSRDVSEADRYGRLLRYVWLKAPKDPKDREEVRTKMLNGILVAEGLAKPEDYPPDTLYSRIFWEISGQAEGE